MNPDTMKDRITRLKEAVQNIRPVVCPERALLWTDYARKRSHRKKPQVIRMAEALHHVLLNRTLSIYPDELLVGNFTSGRVGGGIYPELHGIQVLMEIGGFPERPVNPLSISKKNIRKLRRIIPFWLLRNIPAQTYASPFKAIPFLLDQFTARHYLINELGGIVHFAPDYESLIRLGAEGLSARAALHMTRPDRTPEHQAFLQAVKISAKTLSMFGVRYAELAESMAMDTPDTQRRDELLETARICRKVPGKPAETFHEALQSILLAHIAINHESIDVTICLGRMDLILYPYYLKDIEQGILTPDKARELLACFAVKLCETVPAFSKLVGRFHSGLPSFQTLVVGGVDKDGNDASNALSILFLNIMNDLRMRQPNFQARIHANAPATYLEAVYRTLAQGSNPLAVYNDDVIIPTMTDHGYSLEDARNYTPIGCVEPTCQGKSFGSTDAALFNTPMLIELALNRGRRFGSMLREGAKTQPPSTMNTMDDVFKAFETQLQYKLSKLITDLRHVETANRRFKPTPLSSMLIDGCIDQGTCSTAGGAKYNFSGIQCVGPTEAGDSLYAIEKLVFTDRVVSLKELVTHLKKNVRDPVMAARMKNLSAFGNGDAETDRWTSRVIDGFVSILNNSGLNTRGGRYVTGLYSSTSHDYFGSVTSALPSGRKKGEPFPSGLAPSNGRDRHGATALLNSMNHIDVRQCLNGVNFNMKFQKTALTGDQGRITLKALLTPYFNRGGMQVQVNVLDRKTLMEARDFPERHPGLLVRVSGYSAYFSDLSDAMKDEIIRRTEITA